MMIWMIIGPRRVGRALLKEVRRLLPLPRRGEMRRLPLPKRLLLKRLLLLNPKE